MKLFKVPGILKILNYVGWRSVKNKLNKGFPIMDLNGDIERIKVELEELRNAKPGDSHMCCVPGTYGDELADIIIFTTAIAAYLKVDLEKEVMHKLLKNEERKIKPLGNGQFAKIEGPHGRGFISLDNLMCENGARA